MEKKVEEVTEDEIRWISTVRWSVVVGKPNPVGTWNNVRDKRDVLSHIIHTCTVVSWGDIALLPCHRQCASVISIDVS